MKITGSPFSVVIVSLLAVIVLITAGSAWAMREPNIVQSARVVPTANDALPGQPVRGSSEPEQADTVLPVLPVPALEQSTVGQEEPPPRTGPHQEGLYYWRDGDRIVPVRIEGSVPPAGEPAGIGKWAAEDGAERSGADERQDHTGGRFTKAPSDVGESAPQVSVGGAEMSLPGGVLVVLDPAWSAGEIDAFFTANGIASERVSELGFTSNAFLVETAPGIAGLTLSNDLAVQDGVQLASPNWEMQVEPLQDPPQDDHGDTRETATDLELDTATSGTISDENDLDFFKFSITESTYVVVGDHTLSPTEPAGNRFVLYDDDGEFLQAGGLTRWRIPAGTYYVSVGWYQNSYQRANYHVEVRTIPDHGDTLTDASPVQVAPKHTIPLVFSDFHSSTDVDFFRFELDEAAHILIQAHGGFVWYPGWPVFAGFNLQLFDADGDPLGALARGLPLEGQAYHLEAGTYYLRLSPYFIHTSSADEDEGGHAVGNAFLSDLYVFPNEEYTEFIDGCSAIDSGFDDPLYGCQWHLKNTSDNSGTAGEDANVEPAWSHTLGENVNVAIVDSMIDFSHEDLTDNWNSDLTHNYLDQNWLRYPLPNHGLAVAGLIAARDNGLGVRGVAPRASFFGHNFVERDTLANLVDAMTRSRSVTAVSNNSWVTTSSVGRYTISEMWVTALETGISEGFNGKGTLYVYGAGNAHRGGWHVNLSELRNHYAQVTVLRGNGRGNTGELL